MLETWGYRYLCIGTALAQMEEHLGLYLSFEESSSEDKKQRGFTRLPADHEIASILLARCHDIENFMHGQDLGSLHNDVSALEAKIMITRREGMDHHANDLQRHVERLTNNFAYILQNRFFYSIRPEFNELYGKPALFGERVAKKFPKASDDIEWAGNCLALGQPTACVFHLDRAMEIALRKLANRLGLTPAAKDTMGKILHDMEAPINAMPDKAEKEKRKKEMWSDCRINLRHVKSAWRDPTAHGKKSYEEKQAIQVFDRVKEFMQQLATLL
jgi:hypothetical protein